ncbi:MAG: amino acid permease, partial [Elusimicrobiota bacterium]
NGVLNRLAEDGVLADWFRWLHPQYGTTHRMIHLLVALQVITILACGGDVYVLGEAYAFGVIWSFIFMALAVMVLRYKPETAHEWKVPPNIRIGGREIPIGMIVIFGVLLMAGLLNLVTKKAATIWGGAFSIGFYLLILLSEKMNERRRRASEQHREKLNQRHVSKLPGAIESEKKRDRILVAIRNPSNIYPLNRILEEVDTDEADIVVLHSKPSPYMTPGTEHGMGPEDELLFTNVIQLAEKHGKTVKPLLVTSNDPAYAVAQAAHSIDATQVVMGSSRRQTVEDQIERLAMTWGALGVKIDDPIRVRVLWGDGKSLEAELT